MKKVIVACGGAVATSTVAANKIKELCKLNNIDVEIIQCRLNEISAHLDGVNLIATTSKLKKEFDNIPVISVMGFISGINQDKLSNSILEILKN